MMRRLMFLGLSAALVTLNGAGRAQDKKDTPAVEKKVSVLKFIVPSNVEVELSVDGKPVRTKGDIRELKTPAVEAGVKYTYDVEATIIPNNYTVIKRPRKITFIGGTDLTVDLTKEDKALDKIEVRWVPTPEDVVDEMAKIAKVGRDDVVFDLGCGDGVMLIRPVKNLNAKRGVGIEIKENMVKEAKLKVKEAGLDGKIDIRQGDILEEKDLKDLPEATVVMLYIGDDLGARLEPILKKALKPGSRVVSHRFVLGGWKPDKTVTFTGKDGEEYTLHLWEIPK